MDLASRDLEIDAAENFVAIDAGMEIFDFEHNLRLRSARG
jgi:hypothetical protein